MDGMYGIMDKWKWMWSTVQGLVARIEQAQFVVCGLELKGNGTQYRLWVESTDLGLKEIVNDV